MLQMVAVFRQAARNAIDAGFDGVEVHGANVSCCGPHIQHVIHSRCIAQVCMCNHVSLQDFYQPLAMYAGSLAFTSLLVHMSYCTFTIALVLYKDP